MRIGIDARMYGPRVSGIGNYVKNLIQHLISIDSKNEYVLFFLKDGYEEFFHNQQNVKKVLVDAHWYTTKEQTRLWRIMEKEKTDVMHFTNFNVPIFFTRKFVVTIHDMTQWTHPGHLARRSFFRKLAFRSVFGSGVKRAERIITVSNHSKEQIAKKYAGLEKKIDVVYLGLDDIFQNSKNYGIIDVLKSKYRITKPYLFYIGVFREHKNIPGLLRAFAILREKHGLDMQLFLGGDLRYKDPGIDAELKRENMRDSVIMPGFIPQEELPALYHGAAITVIPSFNEGFGLNALESLECGTAVAASNTTSVPEILGNACMYFNPENTEEMVQVLRRMIQDEALRSHLVHSGQGRVKRYRWSRCAQETLNIYNDVLEKSL